MFDIPKDNLPECLGDENRINVLFAPIRNKSVNPKDWDNKISSWRTIIKAYCESNDIYTFTVFSLNKVFIRNGRSPPCLPEVISEMEKNGDVQRLSLFLKSNPKTWTGWATDVFVKTPFIWSFNKLKSSIFATDSSQEPRVFMEIIKTKCENILNILPSNYKNKLVSLKDLLNIIKKTPNDIEDIKLLLHYMSNKNLIDITKLDSNNHNELETTLIKFGDGTTNNIISEVDIGIYTLEQNEKIILKGIEEMEDNIEKLISEAKVHLSKHHRQMAKSCLRKKHDLEKSLEKKAQALHNIQLLLHQIKESNSNATVWDSYKKVLSAFDVTYKDISEDVIDDTMIKLGEVLDKNEDIQSALSKPAQDFDDTDLEQELADLIKDDYTESGPPDGGDNTSDIDIKLENLSLNLPEVPDNSPEKSKKEVDLGSSQL